MKSYYVVVRYRQLTPGGFSPGEETLVFADFASAQRYAETMQHDAPQFWWQVETRRGFSEDEQVG